MLRYAIIIICTLCFVWNSESLFLYNGCGWYSYFTFHFVHINVFHFAANMLVMWIMLKYEPYKRFIAGFASAVFASFLSSFLVPTVGFSGVLFGMLGYAVGSNPTFKGLLWCLPSLALFFFIPDTNALLHLLSWSFAFGIGLIVRLHNQIAYDLKDTTTE